MLNESISELRSTAGIRTGSTCCNWGEGIAYLIILFFCLCQFCLHSTWNSIIIIVRILAVWNAITIRIQLLVDVSDAISVIVSVQVVWYPISVLVLLRVQDPVAVPIRVPLVRYAVVVVIRVQIIWNSIMVGVDSPVNADVMTLTRRRRLRQLRRRRRRRRLWFLGGR